MVVFQDYGFEICRKVIPIPRYEETFSEWCNTHFAVRTGKGIQFYDFSHNLESLDKRLDFVESFVKTPTSSPNASLFDCKLVRNELKNREMPEMMLDPALWGHSDHLIRELSNILLFEFSPQGLIRNKDSALAILNNTGNLEVYTKERREWCSILNFSSLIKDQFTDDLKQKPQNFCDLKNIAYHLTICTMCWSPHMNNDFCYLVTCQKSGIVFFWKMQYIDEKLTATCCGKIVLEFHEIIHLKWIPKSKNNFIILCSNMIGQVMALECQIDEDKVVHLKSQMIWEHQDRMLVSLTEYRINGNKILLFYNKHRHFVAQLLDEHCRVISQSVDNINDYRISSITRSSTEYYVSTVNFKLYKVNCCIDNNGLKTSFDLIHMKDISPTMELYCVRLSRNGVICALNAQDRKVMNRKPPLLKETIFVQTVSDETLWDILINNPTKQLTYYWDCVELLRFKMVKIRMVPSIDFKAFLSEGETDTYKLKIYLIVLKIYRTLVNNIKIPEGLLPENSIEFVKDKIIAACAKSNIKKIRKKQVTQEKIGDLEMQCLAGSQTYLKLHCEKYKINMADPDMLNEVVEDYKYPCQCCDEQIKKFSCINGHMNMFCSLTFTPIDTLDYLMCKYCDTIARLDLLPDKPTCVFCDSYLEKYNFCE